MGIIYAFCVTYVSSEEPVVSAFTAEPEELVIEKPKKDIVIRFSFDNEDLSSIVDLIAQKTGKNIIKPQGANAITQKITFKQTKKIKLSQAEKYLYMFLELAGYTMHPNSNFFVIIKTDPNVTREPYPIYINVAPDDLPNSEERIRAVYYLANLKVPENIQDVNMPLNAILKDMLSVNSSYIFDPKSNGIIITDKSNTISSVMKIITELDASGSKDVIEIVPLYNSVAKTVAELLKTQLIATAADAKGIIRTDIKTESGLYFATNTRVVSDDRTNSLIIMGRETAVERLKEFVRDYMDAEPESGQSILHSYDLQYLDAETFAKVLQDIVAAKTGPAGQSQKDIITGPSQYFEQVRIAAEVYKPIEAAKTITGGTAPAETAAAYQGGNRLIIAARKKDWKRIKELIHELDKPQRQVIIEVMIVDLTLRNERQIASQMRNPSTIDLPPGTQIQSAQIIGPILNDDPNTSPPTPPTTLDADLLRLLLGVPLNTSLAVRQTSGDSNGALIVSFNDPNGSGIWNVLKILRSYSDTKVLSHPFLVTLNNTRGEEVLQEIRRAGGDQSIGEGGISTIRQQDFTATLKVSVVPRISSLERLNLQVVIEIDDFVSDDPSDFTRVTRRVQTNANISSGQVLVLGGLTILFDDQSESETPLLGRIPIIGWLFKNKTKTTAKNNLAVFISPTIVEPKLRAGQARYTADKIERGYSEINEGLLFDNMRDPITRWFFRSKEAEDKYMLDEYIAHTKESALVDAVSKPKKIKAGSITTDDDEIANKKIKALVATEENPLLSVQK